MEQEVKKLMEKKKEDLLHICQKLGLKTDEKMGKKVLATMIAEEVDDLNTWIEAKSSVGTIQVASKKGESKKSVYRGKCVKTGKKLYS